MKTLDITLDEFEDLADYSCTDPTGVIAGKTWKRAYDYYDRSKGYYICRYEEHDDPKKCWLRAYEPNFTDPTYEILAREFHQLVLDTYGERAKSVAKVSFRPSRLRTSISSLGPGPNEDGIASQTVVGNPQIRAFNYTAEGIGVTGPNPTFQGFVDTPPTMLDWEDPELLIKFKRLLPGDEHFTFNHNY